jgi:uncharacterized protein (DUF983 family)
MSAAPWFVQSPTAEAQHVLDEMEASEDLTSAPCPHCGAANLFPGFSQILAFTCRECGKAWRPVISDDHARLVPPSGYINLDCANFVRTFLAWRANRGSMTFNFRP